MGRYYIVNKDWHLFDTVKQHPSHTEEERGLADVCPRGDGLSGHDWLMLPKDPDQKQYLLCMNCGERSHL